MRAALDISKATLKDFCEARGIRWMAFFGSVIREDFRPGSDVDVLVEFEPGRVPGMVVLAGYAMDLESVLGRDVDLRTPRELSRYFRQRVIGNAETVYGHR